MTQKHFQTTSGKMVMVDETTGEILAEFDAQGRLNTGCLNRAERDEIQNRWEHARAADLDKAARSLYNDPDAVDTMEEMRLRDDAEELDVDPEKFIKGFFEEKANVRRQRGSTAEEKAARKTWEKEVESLRKTISERNERGWNADEQLADLIHLQENEPPPIQKGEGYAWQEDPDDEFE